MKTTKKFSYDKIELLAIALELLMESKGIKVSGYSDSIVNIYSETAIKEAKTLISEVEGLIMNKNTTIDEIGNGWVNSIFGSTKTINFLLSK